MTLFMELNVCSRRSGVVLGSFPIRRERGVFYGKVDEANSVSFLDRVLILGS